MKTSELTWQKRVFLWTDGLAVPPAGRKVRGEYGMKEATHGLAQLDLHDQEFRDLEVARKLQDEELKVSRLFVVIIINHL